MAFYTGARHKCTSLATVPDINVTEVLIAILCLHIDAFYTGASHELKLLLQQCQT